MFRIRTAAVRHESTHAHRKRHTCSLCTKSFHRRDHWQEHEAICGAASAKPDPTPISTETCCSGASASTAGPAQAQNVEGSMDSAAVVADGFQISSSREPSSSPDGFQIPSFEEPSGSLELLRNPPMFPDNFQTPWFEEPSKSPTPSREPPIFHDNLQMPSSEEFPLSLVRLSIPPFAPRMSHALIPRHTSLKVSRAQARRFRSAAGCPEDGIW